MILVDVGFCLSFRCPMSLKPTSLLLVLGVFLLYMFEAVASAIPSTPLSEKRDPDVEVFVRKGCPHCEAAKNFLNQLQQERPLIRIIIHDVAAEPSASARLKDLTASMTVGLGVPTFYVRGELIVGFRGAEQTGNRIKALLDQPPIPSEIEMPEGACSPVITAPCGPKDTLSESETEGVTLPLLGRLTVQNLGLPLFTFTIGLVDGFNPCSMWVLLFMIAMLATLKDRKKMLLIAGTFVVVEGVAYFAFMAAWLNTFLIIGLSRVSEMVLGVIAMLAGMINMKDFWMFRRGVSLGIPESVKPTIYAKIRSILQAENLRAALFGAVVLAVLVQVVEFLCTAGFPALYTRILTLRHLEGWTYYAYLVLYNIAYMLDDVIVLTIGVVTLSQRRLKEREGRWLKLIGGAVMVGLGIALIIKPEWLSW
jgi:glutaredoxin